MKMVFEEAVKAYISANVLAFGHAHGVCCPLEADSDMDASGRWTLRNGLRDKSNGFLAYVTPTGKVLNSRFKPLCA